MPPAQYTLSVISAALVVGLVVELLRRRQLKEKYAVLWLVVGSGIAIVSVFPELLRWIAGRAAITVPINLLFFLAILLLLGVSMHLSWESSRLEDRNRTLADEVALLNLRVDRLEADDHPAAVNDAATMSGPDRR